MSSNSFSVPVFRLNLLLITSALFSCNLNEMKFDLKEHNELTGIPSASGLEVTESGIYVIGDNSPYLFQLNKNFEIINKINIFPQRNFPDSIIEKPDKPDLEAIARGNVEGNVLFAFGSGSKSPERDLMVEIDLTSEKITEHPLVEFYSLLRKTAGLSPEELNIEAAEVYNDEVYLFNRGKNFIVRFSLTVFREFLIDPTKIPEFEVLNIDLPEIDGITSGFSGASLDPKNGKLFFTATVENTENWIDDGEVLGSFIGVINISDLRNGMKPDHIAILLDKDYLKIKVESVAVLKPFKPGEAELLMVTDSDGGISELLRGTLFYE